MNQIVAQFGDVFAFSGLPGAVSIPDTSVISAGEGNHQRI